MFLVEKHPTETASDVESFLEALIGEIYGRRPAWLDYHLRESYRFQGREFIRMWCPAGSVQGSLSLRASTGAGVTRDFLMLGTRDGRSRAWLLRRGEKSEFNSEELKRIENHE